MKAGTFVAMALLALGLAVGGTSYAQSGDSKPSAKSSKKVSKKADKKSAKKKGKKTADVAVVFIGRAMGESMDNKCRKGWYYLTGEEISSFCCGSVVPSDGNPAK